MKMDYMKKQVKIEHIKLQAKHFAFSSLSVLFAIMTWLSLLVVHILSVWTGNDKNRIIIGIFASILYFVITIGLTILFINLSFSYEDRLVITGHTQDYDTVWKYYSEILAERKLKKRGFRE